MNLQSTTMNNNNKLPTPNPRKQKYSLSTESNVLLQLKTAPGLFCLSPTFSGGLHAGGGVDGVAEEAVARHGGADDAGNARPRVHSDAHLQSLLRPVGDVELLQTQQ